jgi:glycosyltransferase involved in cell wall biosynthesis
LSVVVPCHNEAVGLRNLHAAVAAALDGVDFELILVDDASVDGTAELAGQIASADARVRPLRLLRNSGQQAALRAGLRAARGAFVATLDADLEHPPERLRDMLAKAREGFDVVQMVRRGRQPGFFKNLWSRLFYRLFNAIVETPLPPGASDFRVLSRRVCEVINGLPERRLFLRALLPQLGFPTCLLEYDPGPARPGQPAFTFGKSLRLGVEAVFAHSTLPLRWAMRVGLLMAMLAFAYAAYNVGAKFFGDGNVPGYTDLIGSVLLLGGLILLYLGILGRYMLVILDHLKNRPEYLVEDAVAGSRRENRDGIPPGGSASGAPRSTEAERTI